MDNIQSHTHTVMEFPETGIIRFMGDNSNGKSVMVKVLQDVVSNAISRPANRRSIVRRGHSYGELLLESYDGRELFVQISLEAAQTWAELRTTGAQPIRRYLSDKAIPSSDTKKPLPVFNSWSFLSYVTTENTARFAFSTHFGV